MSHLAPFSYQSHVLRVEADADGEPLFHGGDLCSMLGYQNPRDAIRRHVYEDDVVKRDVTDALGRPQLSNFVREPGLWSLILGSETEQARAVKRWVTAEVLPSIRKSGGYQSNTQQRAKPARWPARLTQAQFRAAQKRLADEQARLMATPVLLSSDEYIYLSTAAEMHRLSSRPTRRPPLSETEKRQAAEMVLEHGLSKAEAARRLGCHTRSIGRALEWATRVEGQEAAR